MRRRSRLCVVSYAINGRGMGHLVRQLAILRWIRRICALLDVSCELWVLTSSEADTLARREGFASLKMPSKAMLRDANVDPARFLAIARGWVVQTLAGLQPDLLLVDTFPAGSFGELIAALELATHRILVARRVRPEFEAEASYQALLPLYDAIIRPDASQGGPIVIREPSELFERDEARRTLGVDGDRPLVWLTLGGGGDLAAAGVVPRLARALRDRGWHVAVGAGPLYQGEEVRGNGITWLSRYTPVELLPGVDVAVSAGGYNSFHELMMVGVPTVFLPQPRIADDQAERVDRAVAAGAGLRAASVEAVPDTVAAVLALTGAREAARSLVPVNGARAAAVRALAPLLPSEDLELATKVLTPELLRLIERGRGRRSVARATQKTLQLARLLGEGTPRFVALCDGLSIPVDQAQPLMASLGRTFPAAEGGELLAAAEALFPLFARFDDWMGAVSLLRAVPRQRNYRLADFVADVSPWLAKHDDLFDAVRDLSRVEGGGDRTVAEALRLLGSSAEAK